MKNKWIIWWTSGWRHNKLYCYRLIYIFSFKSFKWLYFRGHGCLWNTMGKGSLFIHNFDMWHVELAAQKGSKCFACHPLPHGKFQANSLFHVVKRSITFIFIFCIKKIHKYWREGPHKVDNIFIFYYPSMWWTNSIASCLEIHSETTNKPLNLILSWTFSLKFGIILRFFYDLSTKIEAFLPIIHMRNLWAFYL